MKYRAMIVSASAVFGLAFLLHSTIQGVGNDPVAIKVVMAKAMKSGLHKRVVTGEATDEETKNLIALFTELAKNKCPKGDADDWKARTEALIAGAKSAKEDGGKALKKAGDCKGCHLTHR